MCSRGFMARTYGWIPDLPDARDNVYQLPLKLATPPPSVDLRSGCPAVYDQGDLGSCTANAIGAAIEFDQKRQKLPASTPSRLFIYYNERVIEGSVDSDSGAQIRDGIKAVASQGACPETMWPYVESSFATCPPEPCYTYAKLHPAVQYARVAQDAGHLKTCLAAGFPFVFGFTVYESFESDAVAKSGIVPMPGAEESAVGGHAVMAVGYDDAASRFLVRNSWGSGWGVGGYFTIPYAYLADEDLADDFWVIRVVK
jgi:C1A family cysteine protease